jgi:hypothetical protein
MVLGGQPPGRVGRRQEAFSIPGKLESKYPHLRGILIPHPFCAILGYENLDRFL